MKRRIKKKLRDKNNNMLCITGNNYGDFVEITPMVNDRIYIHSGHCCVTDLDKIIPNEVLSMMINQIVMDYGSVEEFVKQSGFDKDYKNELLAKIS